jgi:hypothetical protein
MSADSYSRHPLCKPMKFLSLVILFFCMASAHALTSPKRGGHIRTISPSLAQPNLLRRKSALPFLSQTVTSPRSVLTSLASSLTSSNIHNEINEVRRKYKAVEYCLDNFGSIAECTLKDSDLAKAPEDIREFIPIYEGFDQATLISFLVDLQAEVTALIFKATDKSRGP